MKLSFTLLAVLLAVAVIFMAVTVALIPKIVVRTAPKDIQEKVLARPDAPVWKTVTGCILAVLILLCAMGILIYAGMDAVKNHMNFMQIFVRYLILLEGYKIFDMICFDYILLTKLNIFQKCFPETIGCKGYEKFGFNLKSQIAKLIIFAVISLVTAWILSNI